MFEARESITGCKVAAKCTDLSKEALWKCHENEVSAFRRLGTHPNIVKYYDDYTVGKVGVLILEKLVHGSLEDHVKRTGRLSIDHSLEVLAQLCSAVELMHGANLSPRDLKAENIAFDAKTRHVKMFDLGFAITVRPQPNGLMPLIDNTTGSPLFMAPEVLKCDLHDTFAADMWCLGTILYTMLVGQCPFQHCKTLEMLREAVHKKALKFPHDLPHGVTLLLRGMLDYDPRKRLRINQVRGLVEQLIALEDNSENRGGNN